jgi:phage shock protein B
MRVIGFLAAVMAAIMILGGVSIVLAIFAWGRQSGGDFGIVNEDTLAILCVALVVIVGIVARTIVHLEKSRSRNASKERDPEETRLIQEMHRNLTRMEERIEALETLYMDKAREESFTQRL